MVANLSVHQAVGSMLCLNEELILCHIQLLETFLTSDKEELVLNTLVSVHNLSFYQVEGSQIYKHRLKIVEGTKITGIASPGDSHRIRNFLQLCIQ